MEVKVKDAAVYIRKYLLNYLESTYRFACGHPFASCFVFSLLLLHSSHPFLFAFLVSSSPVLISTALLLGILLCYGEPNIPEIEEDDKLNGKVSSLKVENSFDDLFVKKDKSYPVESHLDSRNGTKGRTSKDSVTDDENDRLDDFLAVRSLAEEPNKTEEDCILEHGFVENVGDLMEEQSQCNVRMSEVADGGGEGVDSLIRTISRSEPDDCLDSSLGSPWQHINIHDAASDSESDQAESSSTDASITDILPMLNKLHPLLDSKAAKSVDNSDVELSQHTESDDDSVKQEGEHIIEESDASKKIVTWTADDQKNIMDLGSSDLERNRRLESLIARRRARKNQIIIFEQDLINLHSNDKAMDHLFRFHPQIPPISAPRRNPFDLHHESEESKGYPPIPGSAPSVLVHRHNPFDFSCDSENGSKGLTGDNLCQPEFEPPSQRGISFRGHDSFASRSLFPINVMHEKHGSSGSSTSSRLKHCVVGETMGLQSNEYVDLDTVSSPLDPKHQKELAEQERQEDTELPVSIHDTTTNLQDGQSYRGDLVNFEAEHVEGGHFVDTNFPSLDASVESTWLMFDCQKHEVDEEKDDNWTLFTSSEDKGNSLHISLHEALETQGQITSLSKGTTVHPSDAWAGLLFCETDGVNNSQAAVPVYDSSPSGSGNFIANIYMPDDTLLSSGRGCPNSTLVESHAQEDVIEVVSHARAVEENMTSGMMEFEMVHGSKLQNKTSSSGEPATFSTYINLLDEDTLTTKGTYFAFSENRSSGLSETGDGDFTENSSPGLDDDDFGDVATSLEVDLSSSLSSRKADMDAIWFASSAGLPTSDVEAKHRSLEKIEMQTHCGYHNFELRPILEESLEDPLDKEGQVSLFMPPITSSTGSQILEEPSACKSSVGQKVIPLHSQSEAAVGDEGNGKGIAFSPENATPSMTSNLLSANDDRLSGLPIGELLDSMDFSNLYKMKSEYEFTSNVDINDSQASDITEFQINQDIVLRNLNAEHGDEEAESREIHCFDERLLSELDAVGDFQAGGFESQQCLEMELQSASQLDCTSEVSALWSPNMVNTSPKKPLSFYSNNLHEIDLILNQKETTDPGFWSSAVAPVDDLELTVYKPKFNVLQVSSLEELDSTFKQGHPEESAEPSLSETSGIFVTEKPRVGLSMSDQEIETIHLDAPLLTPNEKNVEDIKSDLIEDARDFGNPSPAHVYFQINDNQSSEDINSQLSSEVKSLHVEAVIPSTSGLTSYISAVHEAEVSSTELDISSRDLDGGETDSELFVEAKLIGDTDSAFKHASDFSLNEYVTPPVNSDPMINHPVDNVVEGIFHEAEKTSGLLFLEAKSTEDINSAFKEATKEGLATTVFQFSDPGPSRTCTDFEKMELNSTDNVSELFVVEAKSAEDIQLAFKQAVRGVSTMPTLPLVDLDLIRDTQDLQVVEAMYPDMWDNSEMLVSEGKSSEDIGPVLKQFDIEKMVSRSNVKLEADETRPCNAKNDTEPLALGKKVDTVTSAFQQATDQVPDKSAFHQVHIMSLGSQVNNDVVDVYSLETQIVPELSVIDAKSVEDIDLNSALELDNEEFAAHSTSQDDSELRYFHQGYDVMDKKSLRAEDNSEIFTLERKSFDDAHLDFKEAAAVFFHQSKTILVDPKHNSEEVMADKSPDSCNNLDFLVAEAKPLEDSNLSSEQTAKGFLSKPTLKDAADYEDVRESFFAPDNYSELVVSEEKSFVQSASAEATTGVCEVSSSLPADPNPIEIQREKDNNVCFEVENNSEILVIEAKSLDDINSALKLATSVPSSTLLTNARSFDTDSKSSLLVFEEKSDLLTNSALTQVHEEGSIMPLISFDNQNVDFMEESSHENNELELAVPEENSEEYISRSVTLQDDSKPETRSKVQQKEPELSILEPMSVGDSDVIVEQVSEEGNKKTPSSKNEEGSAEGIDQEIDEHVHATTAVDTRERQHDAEAEYAKETVVLSDETVTSKSIAGEDQMNKRTDEGEIVGKEEIVYENPHCRAPTLLNIKKKEKKSEKSDSSSSSSSSSSDSEC